MENHERREFLARHDRGRAAPRDASSRTYERAACTTRADDARRSPALSQWRLRRRQIRVKRQSESRCFARAARWCGESSFQARFFEIAESAVDRAFVDSLRVRHDQIVHDQHARDGARAVSNRCEN